VALRPPDTRADRPAAQSKLIEPLGSPLDRVLAGPIGGSQGIGREMADSLPRPGHRGAAAPADRGSAGAEDTSSLGPAGMGVSSLAEAGDVFAGMRRVSGRLRAPLGVSRGAGTEVEAGPAATARRQAALRRPLGPKTGIPSGLPEAGPTRATPEPQPSPAAELAAQPLKTFVGTEESVMNRYLADAEAMLKSGQYYKAASAYDFARAVDLRNPLPLVGRSMALLAAGDYMTSVTNLFQAIKLYESLADFAIDMRKFIPDMAVLDRRRADLERLLERFEDFRLRFLLGYAEYCSGLEEIGLSDLEKAAQAAPREMSFVPRFVEALKRRTVGPSKPIGVSP